MWPYVKLLSYIVSKRGHSVASFHNQVRTTSNKKLCRAQIENWQGLDNLVGCPKWKLALSRIYESQLTGRVRISPDECVHMKLPCQTCTFCLLTFTSFCFLPDENALNFPTQRGRYLLSTDREYNVWETLICWRHICMTLIRRFRMRY